MRPAALLQGLEAREELCSTGIPGGLALLHSRNPESYLFEAAFLALGRTIQQIPFGAPDGQPTNLFFLIGCPDDRMHLHTLARLCLMAQKTDLLVDLRQAADADAMCRHTLTVVIPWPVFYETLNTRFARNLPALRQFEIFLKRPGIDFLDDTPYRQEALNRVFEWLLQRSRPFSATDCVLRLILDDVAIRIDFLAIFNERDFADVCRRRGVELL